MEMKPEEGIYIVKLQQILGSTCFVGEQTQNGPANILHNHQTRHKWEVSRRALVVVEMTVHDAGRCFFITHHLHRLDLVHCGAN